MSRARLSSDAMLRTEPAHPSAYRGQAAQGPRAIWRGVRLRGDGVQALDLADHRTQPLDVSIGATLAARPAGRSDLRSRGLVGDVEAGLVDQLGLGAEELRLAPLFEKGAVLVGAVGQQHAAAGRYLEGAGGVLVGADLAQEA